MAHKLLKIKETKNYKSITKCSFGCGKRLIEVGGVGHNYSMPSQPSMWCCDVCRNNICTIDTMEQIYHDNGDSKMAKHCIVEVNGKADEAVVMYFKLHGIQPRNFRNAQGRFVKDVADAVSMKLVEEFDKRHQLSKVWKFCRDNGYELKVNGEVVTVDNYQKLTRH